MGGGRRARAGRAARAWKSGSAPWSATASALELLHFSTRSDIEKMPRSLMCCDSATLPPASLIVRDSAATRPLRSGPAAVTTTALFALHSPREPVRTRLARDAMDGRRSAISGRLPNFGRT